MVLVYQFEGWAAFGASDGSTNAEISLVRRLFRILLHLGPAGPFLLGIADSSFLFLPWLLVIIARNHVLAWEYVPIASTGSVIGIFLLDLVSRKGGEAGLKKMMSRKRFDYLKKKMGKRAAYVIMLAGLAPPPFPFTAVMAAASAFQYSPPSSSRVTVASRLLRFTIVATLAIVFGHQITSIVRSSAFYWTMVAFTLICLIGSLYSAIGWIRRSRKPRGA